MDRVLDLVQAIEAAGIAIQHNDFGRGVGINNNDDQPTAAAALWTTWLARLESRRWGVGLTMMGKGRWGGGIGSWG